MTNRSVNYGPEVDLKLRQNDDGLFETRARVIWTSEGVAPTRDVVGALLGVSFLGLSDGKRQRIKRHFLSPEVLRERPCKEHESHRFRFDLLIDPDIDRLFNEGRIDEESALDQIRRKLAPYLPKS